MTHKIENNALILTCDPHEASQIQELAFIETGEYDWKAEGEALESLLANSDLDWIQPKEIGALTSAPILGIRNKKGKPVKVWGFMDYQIRSFLQDLVENRKAVFTS